MGGSGAETPSHSHAGSQRAIHRAGQRDSCSSPGWPRTPWPAPNLPADGSTPEPLSGAGTAAVNTLLAAAAGLIVSYIQAAWQKRRPEPSRLCRGLLGGAVASCGGAGLIDPWAAFVIGGVAGGLVQWTVDLPRAQAH